MTAMAAAGVVVSLFILGWAVVKNIGERLRES